METVDVTVIGAGVIGLAIAERLARPNRSVVVLERHDSFGRETSSRNSEVIHAGLYYGEDLLKTRLCVRGNPLLYELCVRAEIPHRMAGKIIVANDEREMEQLHAIQRQAVQNGVPDVELIDQHRMLELEPHISGLLGLYSHTSGIIDSHCLMKWLEKAAIEKGAIIAYGCDVRGLQRVGTLYHIQLQEADGEQSVLASPYVVNAAGLEADRICAMVGIDTENAGYRIHLCKGEYFRISARHRGLLSHLVYPTPSPVHLGAHAVLGLDGSLRLGPNSFYVDCVDYTVDPRHGDDFFEKARRFLPFLKESDLSPDQSGIRPKLYDLGKPFRDFVIRQETDRGFAGLIDLVGIESPGLTACLTIAEAVESLL